MRVLAPLPPGNDGRGYGLVLRAPSPYRKADTSGQAVRRWLSDLPLELVPLVELFFLGLPLVLYTRMVHMDRLGWWVGFLLFAYVYVEGRFSQLTRKSDLG